MIYTYQATLFAIAFDVNRLETRGTAVPILDDVAYDPATGGVDLGFAGVTQRHEKHRRVGGGVLAAPLPGRDGYDPDEPERLRRLLPSA